MNDHCAEHLATLLRLIERGDEIPPELKSHLATCAECARLLDAMNRVQADLERDDASANEEPVVAQTVEKSAAAVSESRRTRNLVTAIAIAATIAAGVWMLGYGVQSEFEGLANVGMAVLIFAPLFIGVTLLILLRKRLREPGRAIYRRLGPGRQLAGVCLGLAESMSVQVVIMRVVFLGLLFANGAGWWLYILLTLLMPTHPDDRQYLLRFQFARLVRRMRGEE